MKNVVVNEDILGMLADNARTLVDEGYYKNRSFRTKPRKLFSEVLKSKFMIVSELKVKSPMANQFFESNMVKPRIKVMAEFSDGMSILTEPNHFLGSLDYLSIANNYLLPVLMKDIIISKQQILAGINSSAVLLIAKILTWTDIDELTKFSQSLGLEVIIEVDNSEDLVKAIETECNVIAINNRDLRTFHVNIQTSLKLSAEYHTDKPIFGFSGYSKVEQIIDAKDGGLSGVLIGSHLSQHATPANFLAQLQAALR